jgi:hypothetical protein
MLVNRSLNEFIRTHKRLADLDERGNGDVAYIPRAARATQPTPQVPAKRTFSGRWSLAAAALLGWLLLRVYNYLS